MVFAENIANLAKRYHLVRNIPGLRLFASTLPNGRGILPSFFLNETEKLTGTGTLPKYPSHLNIESAEPLTFRRPIEKVDLTSFENLNETKVFLIATNAGAGHLRPALSLIASVLSEIECIQIPTISSSTHRLGSRNRRAKAINDLVYHHRNLQNRIYAPIAKQLLLFRDSFNVISTLELLIEKTIKQGKKEVVFIHTNPDPAYIAGFYKRQLEEKHDVKITNVVVITDHFFSRNQCIWPLIDVDIIVAPDTKTQLWTKIDLLYWENKMKRKRSDRRRHLPQVVVCSYPQDPALNERLSTELLAKRQKDLSPENNGPLEIAIPLGGGSPGMPFLADLSKYLRDNGEYNIWTLFKQADGDQETKDYSEAMINCGAETHPVTNNQQLIQAYSDKFTSENPPDIVIVKPGELSNQTMFDPTQVGGAIFLFVEPVGDQEVQNLLFFQSEEGGKVIPNEKDNQILIDLIIELMSNPTDEADQDPRLKDFQQKAMGWRGLSLPRDPKQAAVFIVGLKKFGIFAAMSLHQRGAYENNKALSTTGSRDFFGILDQAYGAHQRAHMH